MWFKYVVVISEWNKLQNLLEEVRWSDPFNQIREKTIELLCHSCFWRLMFLMLIVKYFISGEKQNKICNKRRSCMLVFPVKFSLSTIRILWYIVVNWKRPCFLKEYSLACEYYYVQAGFTLERDNPPMWPHHFIACTQQLTFKDNHELPEKQCLYTNLWSNLAQDIKGNAKLLMIIDSLVSS